MKLIQRNYRSFRVNERTQSIRMMAGVGATPVRRLNALVRLRIAILRNKYFYLNFSQHGNKLLYLHRNLSIITITLVLDGFQ